MTQIDFQQSFRIAGIVVSPQHNQLSQDERIQTLQPKVMAVLCYLARHQQRVISSDELLEQVWKGRIVTHGSVQKSMNSLRNALASLDSDREFVVHFSKRGYQLIVPVEPLIDPPATIETATSVESDEIAPAKVDDTNVWVGEQSVTAGTRHHETAVTKKEQTSQARDPLNQNPLAFDDLMPRGTQPVGGAMATQKPWRWLRGVAVFLCLLLAGSIWTLLLNDAEDVTPVVDRDSLSSRAYTPAAVAKNHQTNFSQAYTLTSRETHERDAEPHPDGVRFAYIQDGHRNTSIKGTFNSHILISDPVLRQEWLLASIDGSWVDLAWSPSGRNLVAVEARRAEGLPQSAHFYEPPNYLYSFHIFTLDTRGQRLLEKNLLSQWQGSISSVTWWDENTLEFVASLGLDVRKDRYRYVITEQQLMRLPALDSAFSPLSSAIRDKHTAVLSRNGSQTQLEFLGPDQRVFAIWPLAMTDVDVSWLPDGSGVLLMDKHSRRLSTLYWNGDTQPIVLPDLKFQKISRPRYQKGGTALLATVEEPKNHLNLLPMTGQKLALGNESQIPAVPRFMPKNLQIVWIAHHNEKSVVWLEEESEKRKHLLWEAEHPISNAVLSAEGHLIYRSGNTLWRHLLDGKQPQLLLRDATDMEPLSYDPANRVLWVIKISDELRNIWRISPREQQEKQMTFGAVGAVLGSEQGVYFQYNKQKGVWRLSDRVQTPVQVSASLPENSHLLYAAPNGLYFVSGGPCRESSIQFLSFETDQITIALERDHSSVMTHDFHPQRGALQQDCILSESNIMELHSDSNAD